MLHHRALISMGLACVAAPVAAQTPLAAAPSQLAEPVADGAVVDKTPRATLRTFGGTSNSATWHGRGPRTFRADLCVGSTTGRYRLLVQRDAASALGVSLVFSDATGRQQRARASDMDMVIFEGVDPASGNCTAGANAWIELTVDEATLLASTAGEYMDSITLVAEPL